MSKRRKIFLLASALLALGIFWTWFRQNEPKHQGRTLAQWIDAARAEDVNSPSAEEYRTALHVLGTNDFPRLINRISFESNKCLHQKLFNILPGGITPQCVLEYLLDKKWGARTLRQTTPLRFFECWVRKVLRPSQNSQKLPSSEHILRHIERWIAWATSAKTQSHP